MKIQHIIEAAARLHGIKPSDITGPSKRRVFTRPRQIVMFIARMETNETYPAIAWAMGRRDHTTIMHGVQAVANSFDLDTQKIVDAVTNMACEISWINSGYVFRSTRAQPAQFKSQRAI